MTGNYLMEIGVENMPIGQIGLVRDRLYKGFLKLFKAEGIGFKELRVDSTVFRFSVIVMGLRVTDRDRFGSTDFNYMSAVYIKSIISSNVPEILESLKNLHPHYNDSNSKWSELSIRWILSLYDSEILELNYEGLPSGSSTYAGPKKSVEIQIDHPGNYECALKGQGVHIRQVDRKSQVLYSANRLSKERGGNLYRDETLLDYAADNTEKPKTVICTIEQRYLLLPDKLIQSVISDRLRSFTIVDNKGSLMPFFIYVRDESDVSEEVKLEMERTAKELFEEISSYYREDLDTPIGSLLEGLKNLPSPTNLGTLFQESKRMEKLSVLIGESLAVGDATLKNVARAAELSKVDLLTHTVGEFTELKGIIGKLLAQNSGENGIVAAAIMEQYLPTEREKRLPQSTAGKILNIADRIDTLTAYEILSDNGGTITTNYDPENAVGVILEIALDNRLDLDTSELIGNSLYIYVEQLKLVFDYEKLRDRILELINRMLKNKFLDRGYQSTVIDSVIMAGSDNVLTVLETIEAITDWVLEEDGYTASKMLVKAELNGSVSGDLEPSVEMLKTRTEIELYEKLQSFKDIDSLIYRREFKQVLSKLSELSPYLERYFDELNYSEVDPAVNSNRKAMMDLVNKVVRKLFKPSVLQI